MNQFLAMVCSTKAAIPLAMEAAGPFLEEEKAIAAHASGVGSYGPDGEPLVSRRPVGSQREDDVRRALAGGFLLHQVSPNLGSVFRAEDSPPYRFRRWIGTMVDDIDPLETKNGHVLAVPPHIARNIKGSRAAEEVFHILLGFLHSYRALEAATPDVREVRRGVDAALSNIPSRYGQGCRAALAVCDGRTMVVKSQDWPLWYAVLGDTAGALTEFGAGTRIPLRDFPARAIVVTDRETDAMGWQRLPDGAFLQIDRIGRYEVIQQ